MIEEVGYCSGIENYSRHLDGRAAGAALHAAGLLPPRARPRPGRLAGVHRRVARDDPADPGDVQRRPRPQAGAGRSRLPAAQRAGQPPAHVRGVRAGRAPGRVRLGDARPLRAGARRGGGRAGHPPHRACSTRSSIKPGRGAGRDLIEQCARERAGDADERVLVTVLTKRLAEDLTNYLHDQQLRVRYLHSEIDTLERVEILRELRRASSTCWSASTCCARGSTCPRCRWSASSTPTRRASCAARRA